MEHNHYKVHYIGIFSIYLLFGSCWDLRRCAAFLRLPEWGRRHGVQAPGCAAISGAQALDAQASAAPPGSRARTQ